MKRYLSISLIVIMVISMFSAFGATANAVTEISNASPCITANVGDNIELTGYSVVFDGESAPVSDLTWKNESGNVITNITAASSGVTKLTAEAEGKSETIYFVTKEADETEYVLFEADFSQYSNISELKDLGFVTNKQDDYYVFSDGNLVIGNKSDDNTRLILPEWLGDFGDYSITTEAKMLETANASRWFGMVFRIQDTSNYYPYYHICTRERTTIDSGIEFAERTISNEWYVAQKTSGKISSLKDDYHTFNVQAYGKKVQYNIDGTENIYVTEAVIGISTPVYTKGQIGITMNCGTLAMKNIKVTVQSSNPVRPAKSLMLINNNHEDDTLRNPIANVQTITGDATAVINDSKNLSVALFNAAEISDFSALLKACSNKRVVPTISITSKEQVDKIVDAMGSKASNVRDVNVIASDATLLAYVREKSVFIRSGLIVDLQQSTLTSKEANVIRQSVRSAPATFCVIKSENATKQAVAELQALAVAVWVQVDSAPNTDEFTIEAIKAVTAGANGIISADSGLVTDLINANLKDNAMTRTPLMIGHRGNPSQAPENSLSGFITAYENGADIFEIDVEITSDGEIIIMHDGNLKRTTNYTGSKTVNQMTLAEVKEYYLLGLDGNVTDEKVPTLREVLDEFKDKDCRIFVEFKGSNARNVAATSAIIKEYGMEDRVDVISFNGSFCTQTQQNMPGMSTGLLTSYDLNSPTYEDAVNAIMRAITDAQKVNSTINTASGVFSIHFAQAAVDRGITVWPWTYVAASNNGAFLSCCDGLTTDDVQWAKNMAKVIQADAADASVEAGNAVNIKVSSTTYGGVNADIASENLVVSVLTGKDCVRVENGNIIGAQAGTATVIYGYPTQTTDGGEYILYTQPITVNVSAAPVTETPVNNILWIVLAVIAAVAVVAVAAVIILKKKKA